MLCLSLEKNKSNVRVCSVQSLRQRKRGALVYLGERAIKMAKTTYTTTIILCRLL